MVFISIKDIPIKLNSNGKVASDLFKSIFGSVHNMDGKLILAMITITLALVFYTAGVFGERKAKSLTKTHVLIFWLGLVFDTIGTLTMSSITQGGTAVFSSISHNLHGITGFLAIVLMVFHALWATWVLYKNDEKRKVTFHKFSITVWLIWLVPYVVGMILGIFG